MRSGTKKLLIIALALVVVGGLLATFAWSLGAQTSLSLFGRSVERQEFNETLAAFQRLDADVDIGTLILREGSQFEISGHYYGDISFEVRGDTLFVSADTPQTWRVTPIGFFNTSSREGGQITITVPFLTTLEVQTLFLGVGNLWIHDVDLHNANIDLGVGNLDASGLFTGRADISSGIGDIVIRIPESRDRFSYSGSVGVGSITVGDTSQDGLGGSISHAVADPVGDIRFDAGIGSVRIEFAS